MSSSLIEGSSDPSLIVSEIPRGYQAANLMQAGVGPEAVIQYEFANGVESSNKSYVKYTAEKITETEHIRACLHGLLAISAGVYPDFFPQGHFKSANHIMKLLEQSFTEGKDKALGGDFLIAFSLRLEEELDRMNVSNDLKERLFKNSVYVFLQYINYLKKNDFPGWQGFYGNIRRLIVDSQNDQVLREYYKQARYEYNIANRNDHIVRTVVDSGSGVRAMIIGRNHIDKYWAKEKRLVKLFEDAKIPIIVVGDKKTSTNIQF